MNIRRYCFIFAFIAVFLLVFCFCPILHTENSVCGLTVEASAQRVDYGRAPDNCNAESAIVIDADSRSVLYAKNADVKRGMASTTKIMTALVAIENAILDEPYAIPKEAVGIEGSSVYLKEGELLTVSELLYCLMLESGNDAATAIAILCAGSTDAFAEMMNMRAEELGLESTHFTNPHGLSDEEHYTTARELAIITAEAMQYPLFRQIAATKTASVSFDSEPEKRHLTNHNKLLFNYKGAIGVKTGYTMRDGKCLVSAAARDGMTVIAVTLKDPSPTATHRALLDSAFDEYESKSIVKNGEICFDIPVENGEADFVTVRNTSDVTLCLPRDAEYEIRSVTPSSLCAPVSAGDIVASAEVIYDSRIVYIIYLEATDPVAVKRLTLYERILGE